MFEARLAQGVLLRKLLDSMKDLVQVATSGQRHPLCKGAWHSMIAAQLPRITAAQSIFMLASRP
jgi:hypothetical protein